MYILAKLCQKYKLPLLLGSSSVFIKNLKFYKIFIFYKKLTGLDIPKIGTFPHPSSPFPFFQTTSRRNLHKWKKIAINFFFFFN